MTSSMPTVPLRNVTNVVGNYHGKMSMTPSESEPSNDSIVFSSQNHLPTPVTAHCAGSCPEYGQEILEHFLVRERTLHRNAGYLANQPEVTERMRAILVDWMVDVHIKFKLHPETFFLAVDIVDRYLAGCQVTRARLQLIGVTATLLAAKHEEIWPPEVKDCIYIAANTYSRDEILEAERDVTTYLQFKLAVPTSYPIMSFLLDALDASQTMKNTALMFLEASAVEFGSLRYLPSMNAFAAIVLANITCYPENATPLLSWPRLLEQLTRTEYTAIRPCAEAMLATAHQYLGASSKYQATRRKFSSSKYLDVASQPFPTQLPF